MRVIVIRAIGEHFSSGGNIGGFLEASPEHVSKLAWNIGSPARCSKPVIAANRGFASVSDSNCRSPAISASRRKPFSMPCPGNKSFDKFPGSGGSARLQKMIGVTRSKDIVMRSKRIPGRQAEAWGFVTECVPDAELESATNKLVDELRMFAPLAQRTAKKLLNDTEDATLTIAIELEGHSYSRLRQSDDFKEGVEAFNSKRPPKYAGQSGRWFNRRRGVARSNDNRRGSGGGSGCEPTNDQCDRHVMARQVVRPIRFDLSPAFRPFLI